MKELALNNISLKQAAKEAVACTIYGAGIVGTLVAAYSMVEIKSANESKAQYQQVDRPIPTFIGPVELTLDESIALGKLQKAEELEQQGKEHLRWALLLGSAALVVEAAKGCRKIEEEYFPHK